MAINSFTRYSFIVLTLAALGCSGGSSNGDVVIQGTLHQGEDVTHEMRMAKHGAGEALEDVEICALGQCSVTDSAGQWGFAVETVPATEVVFTASGHGINDSFAITLPQGKSDITIELENHGENEIHVHEVAGE